MGNQVFEGRVSEKCFSDNEIANIEKRIREITEALKLCDPVRDANTIADLKAELRGIDSRIADRAFPYSI